MESLPIEFFSSSFPQGIFWGFQRFCFPKFQLNAHLNKFLLFKGFFSFHFLMFTNIEHRKKKKILHIDLGIFMFRTTDNTPVVQANETILIIHHLVELYNII